MMIQTMTRKMIRRIIWRMFRRRMPVLFVEVEVERFLIRRKWLLINDDKGTDKEVYSSYSSSHFFGFLRCSFRCIVLYYIVLCCVVLYCIVLCCVVLFLLRFVMLILYLLCYVMLCYVIFI